MLPVNKLNKTFTMSEKNINENTKEWDPLELKEILQVEVLGTKYL